MDINMMMKQAKKMQAEMERAQELLDKKEFVIEKQGIKLIMLGNKTVKSIKIDEMLVDPDDVELLEDILIIAFNDGIKMITEVESANKPNMPGMR